MPRDMERGPYQLLARAVANTHFEESWSDPDISVFSGTGIELTGPTRVPWTTWLDSAAGSRRRPAPAFRAVSWR